MQRVLVTSVDGFTGKHLEREFDSAGWEVVGTVRETLHNRPAGIECDVCNEESIFEVVAKERPSALVHLAAIAHVTHENPEEIYRTNVVGTRNVLSALARTGGPCPVIVASSSYIYGNALHEVLDESTPAAPANDYAVSKLAMEYMARLWAKKLPITIVRPFNYTGVGQSKQFLVPKIVDHFARRAPVIELGNLDVIRDFSDVRTVAYCYRRLIETSASRPSGEAFNTCSGVGYSLRDVIAMMQEIAGYEIEVRVNPAFVRADEVKKLIGNRTKLEAQIGSVPVTAMRDTLEWMYRSLLTDRESIA